MTMSEVRERTRLSAAWVDKKHFAGTKMLGEISFFDGDLGTDKEFLEYEIMDLGVELLN